MGVWDLQSGNARVRDCGRCVILWSVEMFAHSVSDIFAVLFFSTPQSDSDRRS